MKPPTSLDRWVQNAEPGAVHVYHQGFLAVDRRKPAPHDGDTAQRLCRQGLVFLTQARIGPRNFEYRATRAAIRDPELTWNLGYDHW